MAEPADPVEVAQLVAHYSGRPAPVALADEISHYGRVLAEIEEENHDRRLQRGRAAPGVRRRGAVRPA
jgi:hypothetical protein